jgi:hypothetical protein
MNRLALHIYKYVDFENNPPFGPQWGPFGKLGNEKFAYINIVALAYKPPFVTSCSLGCN